MSTEPIAWFFNNRFSQCIKQDIYFYIVGFSSNYNVLITSSKQSTQVEVIQSKPQKGKGSVVPLFELKKQTDLTVFTKDVGRAVTNLSLNTTNELLLVGFDDSLQIFAVILDKGHANTASLTFRLCALSTEPTVNYSTSFPIFLYKFSNSPVPTLVTVETAPTAATHLTFWQIDSHTVCTIQFLNKHSYLSSTKQN